MQDVVKEKYGVDEKRFEGDFLKLEANKPIELEFIPGSVKQVQKPVTDRKTNITTNKWFFEVGIDSVNGKKVPEADPKVLSSTSKRLYTQLKPYMDENESIYKKKFRIEKTGESFETQYTVVPKGERAVGPGPQDTLQAKEAPNPNNGTRQEDG